MTNSFLLRIIAITASFIIYTSVAYSQDVSSKNLLPAQEQKVFLEKLKQSVKDIKRSNRIIGLGVKSLPKESHFESFANREMIRQPLQSANELIILFDPLLSSQEIQTVLSENKLQVIDAYYQIGAVAVDASKRLISSNTMGNISDLSQLSNSPINQLAKQLSKDSRIIQVSPNTVMTPFVIRSSVQARPFAPQAGLVSEKADWGMKDGKISENWHRMSSTYKVGIIDVGFADHEDLDTRAGLSHEFPSNDHGNHVAGIMCALHNNIGVKGVLPNCKAVISTGTSFLRNVSPIEDRNLIGFYILMSEFLGTVLDFMETNSDVRTLNLSLGYNWIPNFGINPTDPSQSEIRDYIRGQGNFYARLLAYAKRRDIAIFSAAGNDSSSLSTPLPARWASAFNFGSFMIEDLDGWTNGIIVEAHNKINNRADFSNVGGHISCPGVDILSTLANSPNAYGELSGTSMASPYCAAAFAAIREIHSEFSLKKSIECLLSSPDLIDQRIPKLNLTHSISNCIE